MNKIIKTETINFAELVKLGHTGLSLNGQSKMVDLLKQEFTEEQSHWYIANLYLYLNYNSTTDFPINLEQVYKMIGFANKGNAMKTIKSNFILNEDYKTVIFPREKNLICKEKKINLGGRPIEDIMLNIDTFKNLCMIAKTQQGKDIRKYYVKLENIFNKIIKDEFEQQKIILEQEKQNATKLLEQEKENTTKLLNEKDKYIAELKEKEHISILYIGHNPLIKNVHKVGISSKTKTNDILVRHENHKSSNPDFTFLFTFETKNAKLIEDLIKLLLKPFKLQKPEWFRISFERMKQLVDFAILVYDNYHVEESVENLIEFISRYRSNRLVNTNKGRIIIEKKLYEDWFNENVIIKENAKINTEMLCNDFYEWYKIKFSEKIDTTHIKLDTGNWSTFFQKEFMTNISNISKLEYIQHKLSLTDRSRGIHFNKCSGFIGFELKSMKKIEFFEKNIYEKYVKEFMTITNNPRHKVARIEIIDHFITWVKNNNYPTKHRIITKISISSIFKDVLIENIETILNKKIQDVCKINYNGCFVGISHSNFPFIGNESSPKELITDDLLIKKQIDSWINNHSKISKVFNEIIKHKKISITNVVKIMSPSYTDLTLNKKKRKWYLIFEKDAKHYYIKQEALDYYNSIC